MKKPDVIALRTWQSGGVGLDGSELDLCLLVKWINTAHCMPHATYHALVLDAGIILHVDACCMQLQAACSCM